MNAKNDQRACETQTPGAVASSDLSGQFFHSVAGDTGEVEWQGCVVGNPAPGWYLVQLFEWLTGEPTVRRLARIEDMQHWLFYENAEAMRFSCEHGVARPGIE